MEGDATDFEGAPALILISIHALRVEGDKEKQAMAENCIISIHALRVEGDCALMFRKVYAFYFYPRPPGGGRPRLYEV